MDDALHGEASEAIEEIFGDRMRRTPIGEEPDTGALVSVLPIRAEEVELLAKVAEHYSIPLAALGTGTGAETSIQPGSVLVRFDLMRDLRLGDSEEVQVEPGVLWLELDNNLGARGRGLAIYPTSAPRATVGGWLALEGVMNLCENPIEMRIPRPAYCLCDPRFPHS